MKTIGLLLIFAINLLPAPAYSQDEIIGIWSASNRTKGGLGSQWTFFRNGNVSLTFGALVDFKYEIQNNYILMHMSKDKIVKEEFTISGDTLTIKSEEYKEPKVMKRAGIPADTKQPLIGNWTYPHYTGQTAFMRYTSHGLAQLSVPFIVESGTYSSEGNRIVIRLHNKEPRTYLFTRNNMKLSLKDSKTKEISDLELLEY